MASIDRIDQVLDAEETVTEKTDALPIMALMIPLNSKVSGMPTTMSLYYAISILR